MLKLYYSYIQSCVNLTSLRVFATKDDGWGSRQLLMKTGFVNIIFWILSLTKKAQKSLLSEWQVFIVLINSDLIQHFQIFSSKFLKCLCLANYCLVIIKTLFMLIKRRHSLTYKEEMPMSWRFFNKNSPPHKWNE